MKIAVIGLGDIAVKAYLPVLTQRDGIELVFCTRNEQRLKQLAKTHRITEYCTDYKMLISHQARILAGNIGLFSAAVLVYCVVFEYAKSFSIG